MKYQDKAIADTSFSESGLRGSGCSGSCWYQHSGTDRECRKSERRAGGFDASGSDACADCQRGGLFTLEDVIHGISEKLIWAARTRKGFDKAREAE